MKADVVYCYKKSRKKQSRTFLNMALLCLIYIAAIYGYEYWFGKTFPEDLRSICIIAFSIASIILFYVTWWLRTHPATYDAIITAERFVINYPGSSQWSFDIKVSDIKRFEHRNTLSHAGSGISKSGVLLNDGSFHEICMNYGGNINKMYKAIKSVNSNVVFPKRLNKKVYGPIEKDYEN
jgi:hypothetical protein